MKNKKIKEIISLLERFTLKKIDGKRFKKEYMKKWKLIRDKKIYFDDNIHGILDELWCDVDVFVSNKNLLKELLKNPPTEEETIDENELRKRTKISLSKSQKIFQNIASSKK